MHRQEWRITVASRPGSWADHESWLTAQEDFLEFLTELGALGVAGWGRIGELGAVFSVESSSFVEAVTIGAQLLQAALEKVGGLPGRLEVEPADYDAEDAPEVERRVRTAAGASQALSASEVAELLRVSRQRVYQLMEVHEDFPRPVTETPRGALWSRADVEAWARRWARRPGRPAASHDASSKRAP